MKVVLFCGGLGTRLREHSDTIPKPLVNVGLRPILWHLMRYYAHFGHKDFILCLGYRGDLIREYFLNYNECLSNDFTLSEGGRKVELHSSDIDDWRITFVDTGLHSNIGAAPAARARATCGARTCSSRTTPTGLSDLPLDVMIAISPQDGGCELRGGPHLAELPRRAHSDADGFVTRARVGWRPGRS